MLVDEVRVVTGDHSSRVLEATVCLALNGHFGVREVLRCDTVYQNLCAVPVEDRPKGERWARGTSDEAVTQQSRGGDGRRDGDRGAASQRHPSQYLQQERKRAVRNGSKACALGSRVGMGAAGDTSLRCPVISQAREPGNQGRRSGTINIPERE